MRFWWTRKKKCSPGTHCGKHGCGKKCQALSEISPGKSVCVKKHHARGADRQRLLDLGIIPSVTVSVVNKAPLGGAIQLRIGGMNLVLSREEAELIEVYIDTP
ncbi:MAG: ferrous iron transport protein A [Deltaproteobacteria bacterium]|nr:ferrous iron transport protein A [Deltaproteobacteria bacterium]